MSHLNRRTFLGLSAAATASVLGACSTGSPGGGDASGGTSGPITWWDHNVNLQKANGAAYQAFTKESGIEVEYTYHQTAKLGQALQLAKQSDQLPDVHSTAGLESSIPALIGEGWFKPLSWDDEQKGKFGDDGLVEGLHSFDGKPYSFPIFADRQYTAVTWFNKTLIEKAGLDPAAPPTSYDDFRAALRKVQEANKGSAGWIWALGHTGRLAEQVNALAQAAGFEGQGGELFATGEFAYHDDAYVQVIEFLASLQQDKLMFPGSSSLDDQTARARWATGAAGFYFDGPWCTGTVQTEMPDFLPQVEVGPMLLPNAGDEVVAYRGRAGGNYYISGGSGRPEEVSDLLAHLVTPEYNTAIANAMAQPPYDLSVVEASNAVEPWKRLVKWFESSVFIAPTAVLRNPDIQQVSRHSKAVKPGLGEIVQGVFSGDVTDIKGTLKKLSDGLAKDRAQALTKATSDGAKVEEDAWAFSNWKPKADFTPDKY